MSPTQTAIVALISWYVAVLLLLALFRVYTSAVSRKPANAFAPDGSDVPGFGQRLTRAHANCYENIPLFVALLLFAEVSGNTAITDPTAMWLVYARVAQSLVHIASVSVSAVLVRFLFFVVQVGLVICWLTQILWF